MKAVVTLGQGGYEQLDYRDVPDPQPGPGEALVRVLAAGVNNTEVNTRLGWYSSSVTGGTNDANDTDVRSGKERSDGGWDKPTPFPFIQGTDCCGEVVEVAPDVHSDLVGKRVLVRSCMRPDGFASMNNIWLGSDIDGAFAEYVKAPASELFVVSSEWSDSELGSIPCAYGTAENMVHRAEVQTGATVLVAGASGGVGSATVQLALRRGATVIALSSAKKAKRVRELGAQRVVDREEDLIETIGAESVDVVIDNVGGDGFAAMLGALRRGGRYVSSGAIAGPMVSMDMRSFYLKDLTLIGCTAWDEPVFGNLVSYIERNEIRPVVAGTFPLSRIVDAQKELVQRKHVGKLVLIPDTINRT